MPFLYICEFSNGIVKVGRSYEDPKRRLMQHAERLSAVGAKLTRSKHYETSDWRERMREGLLIERCANECAAQNAREWFTGLNFDTVCQWAETEATRNLECDESSFGRRLRNARVEAGLTQGQLGVALGEVSKATVCHWEADRHEPNLNQVRFICELLYVNANNLLGVRQPEGS